MRWFVKESQFASHPFMKNKVGWGNGYVLVDKTSPWWGKHYDEVDCKVHGGLTFSEEVTSDFINSWPELSPPDIGMWCFGFDTAHYQDNPHVWPKSRVEEETQNLFDQLTFKRIDI
jgi:hypothetical protein